MRRCTRARANGRSGTLKRDPEKWVPVFGQDRAPPKRLERDDFSSNRHPALAACWSMSLVAKPDSTFAGHALSDNIRRELVLDEGDPVAQLQLALLQALHLDEVGPQRFVQRRDRGVEVAMLLLQARQLRPKLAFFLFRHRRLGRSFSRPCAPAAWPPDHMPGKTLWIIAFWLIPDKSVGQPLQLCTRWPVMSFLGDFRKG